MTIFWPIFGLFLHTCFMTFFTFLGLSMSSKMGPFLIQKQGYFLDTSNYQGFDPIFGPLFWHFWKTPLLQLSSDFKTCLEIDQKLTNFGHFWTTWINLWVWPCLAHFLLKTDPFLRPFLPFLPPKHRAKLCAIFSPFFAFLRYLIWDIFWVPILGAFPRARARPRVRARACIPQHC